MTITKLKYLIESHLFPNKKAVNLIYKLQKARQNNNKLFSNLLWNRLINLYGVHIGSGSKIEAGLILPHPLSIVIGMGAKIGNNVTIYHNVTIGTKHSCKTKEIKYPKIGNNVTIYTNSTILGDVCIGDNSIVGAHSLITEDIEPNSIYAGYPAKKIGTVKEI